MTEAYDGWQVVGMDLHRHDRPSARPRPPAILAPPSGAGQPNILSPARTSGPARGDAHNRIQVNPPRAFPAGIDYRLRTRPGHHRAAPGAEPAPAAPRRDRRDRPRCMGVPPPRAATLAAEEPRRSRGHTHASSLLYVIIKSLSVASRRGGTGERRRSCQAGAGKPIAGDAKPPRGGSAAI